MSKIKKVFKDVRVIIWIVCLVMAFLIIGHQSSDGIVIKGVEEGSDAFNAGMRSPDSNLQPVQLEQVISINGKEVKTLEDYTNLVDSIGLNESIRMKTNKNEYIFLKTGKDIGLSLRKKSSNNLRKGLELQGGTRVLLKPENEASDQQIKEIISVMENRLNVYGLSDMSIRPASDLFGGKYIVVEIAGVSREEVKELIGKQGVFEARIDNKTVFEGGKQDITFVCRNDGTCSGIRNCGKAEEGYLCRFEFSISVTPEAAQRQADATKNLDIVTEGSEKYLSKKIDFYLDGKQVDSLNIGADLKGQAVTNIAISGPGVGSDQQTAVQNALGNMNQLQTILITGSLPTKMEIIKLDSVSPSLGEAFVKNTLFTGLIAVLGVALVIFIRYRKLKIVLPVMICVVSEIYLILGLSALLRNNLDLASIVGIIASVGTGVDDQVVITDEILAKEVSGNFKERIKRAFFVVFAAFAATVASMIPLYFAGAGLLKGFAVVTILGVSIGVFITRPAFANVIRILMEE